VNWAFYLPTRFIVAAAILDVVAGDPDWLPHPVRFIGRAITFGERRLRCGTRLRDFAGGALLVIAIVTLTAAAGWVVVAALQAANWLPGALAATFIAWTTLAARSLNDAVLAVERCLYRNDEDSARREIRALVGRDAEALDRSGLIRAAIESAAENSSDGVIAPLLFLFVGGPVAAIAYKAINTLDSMVGYKDARYLYFGRVAARLDDLANLVPARVTALAIAASAAIVNGRGRKSLRACAADARKHESPNAGYPEAAMAGALGIELGGEAFYGGAIETRPRMGFAEVPLDPAALRTARILMWTAAAMVITAAAVARSTVMWGWGAPT
jgi:adenosylcobinamide-phosphate synthase